MTTFAVQPSGDRPGVLVVSGELDIATVDELLEAARGVLSGTEATLVVDFGGVTFIDSTGLGALVRIHQEATQQGRRFELTRVPADVLRLLDLTGLSEILLDESPGTR